MKVILFFFLFFIGFFSSENDPEKIPWNENQKLTWSDFKGTPSGPRDYVASTNSGITFSYSYAIRDGVTDVSFKIQSYFYPTLSWYRPDIVDAYILRHEQNHFDITELHARMLRKRMSEASFSGNIKEQVEVIYQSNEKSRQQMQNAFDEETEHSRKELEEKRWGVYIANKLRQYDNWK